MTVPSVVTFYILKTLLLCESDLSPTLEKYQQKIQGHMHIHISGCLAHNPPPP